MADGFSVNTSRSGHDFPQLETSLLPVPLEGHTVDLGSTQKILHRLGFLDERHQQFPHLLEIGTVAFGGEHAAFGVHLQARGDGGSQVGGDSFPERAVGLFARFLHDHIRGHIAKIKSQGRAALGGACEAEAAFVSAGHFWIMWRPRTEAIEQTHQMSVPHEGVDRRLPVPAPFPRVSRRCDAGLVRSFRPFGDLDTSTQVATALGVWCCSSSTIRVSGA